MNIQEIIEQLEAQRDRVNMAISSLNGQPQRYKARRATAKRKISAEARKRMSRAQKARWKKAKKSKS